MALPANIGASKGESVDPSKQAPQVPSYDDKSTKDAGKGGPGPATGNPMPNGDPFHGTKPGSDQPKPYKLK